MTATEGKVDEYIDNLPKPAEIRLKLCENYRQANLLRRLLKLSEQREKVKEVSSCK